MFHNAVNVTDTNINTHKQITNQMYLKSHWSVNARRPLSTTLGSVFCQVLRIQEQKAA